MAAYYNEFKPEAAHMLRQLIRDGLIADGEVDERSITEVSSDDIKGFTQCHWFAGIGGWSVALRLALWPDDRPVWTGSCPCQPFSTAGKGGKQSDERHLWPHWSRLISQSKPAILFGEQVASAVTAGWWDDVASDLEAEGYACAAAVLPACSVGKPHRRERLWFVAHSAGSGLSQRRSGEVREPRAKQEPERLRVMGDVANAECRRRQGQRPLGEPKHPAQDSDGQANQSVDDSTGFDWISCPDGKQRPVESGLCLLAHGVQHRAPLLHAFGNAIVPQVAAEFIKAAM